MSWIESIFRFLGWWIINIDMLLVVLIVLGGILFFFTQNRCGASLILCSCLSFIILSVVPVGRWMVTYLENRFPEQTTLPPQAKGLILLGGSFNRAASQARGRTSYNLAAGRLIDFIELAKKYPHLQRVFTGSPSEVSLVKNEFLRLGLDPHSVFFENKATNTYKNALNTAELLKPSSKEEWILVTTAYHMPRSMGLFRKAGFNVIAYPVDYHTTGKFSFWPLSFRRNLDAWYIGTREMMGLIGNYLMKRSKCLFPSP